MHLIGAHPVPSLVFRPIEILVGSPKEPGGLVQRVGKACHTDAAGQADFRGRARRVTERETVRLDGDAQPLGQIHGTWMGSLWGDHHELLTPEASEDVGGAELVFDQPGKRGQDLIAGLMSEAVVDLFEVVDIEQEHGKGQARQPCTGAFFAEPSIQVAAIEYLGQGV